ncbi:MAG: hypothetical protein KKB31_07285 [Nanoarchaeota archaeon]|nr:hypothetical protein [Nanoarchaeota archaeon]
MTQQLINLPPGYDLRSGYSVGGNGNCRHSYPPESMQVVDGDVQYECELCGMWRRYKPYVTNDVFGSGLFLLHEKSVCVIGSGPNGVGHASRIPARAYRIAVNKAVMIPGIRADAWMAMDITLPDNDWWEPCYERFGTGEDRPVTIFGDLLAGSWPADFVFKSGRAMNHDNFIPEPNELRVGATVSAQAVMLAYHLGVKKIYLFGVDMSGAAYWDGTPAKAHLDGEWRCINRFNGMMGWMRKQGVTIESLTTTELDA